MIYLLFQDKKYEHITPEERQESFNVIDRNRAWIQSTKEKQILKNKWEDPITNANEIRNKIK